MPWCVLEGFRSASAGGGMAAQCSKAPRVPVVLTREAVAALFPLIEGKPGLLMRLLYGAGLRLNEAVRLRLACAPRYLPAHSNRQGSCADIAGDSPRHSRTGGRQ